MATKKKSAAAVAAAAEAPAIADGQVWVYPTHKRQSGPLVVGLAAVDGNSDELVIDDTGAAIDKSLADHLMAGGEVTLEKPAEA